VVGRVLTRHPKNLSPYSPDLNPIEKLWANLKHRWRKVGGSLEELIKMSNY
jgi:transposase